MNYRFWYGLIKVTHPDGWLQGALYMLLGTFIGGGLMALKLPAVPQAMAVVGLIIAAGFAFNDYHDAIVDGINRPSRAIPSGQIPRSAALVLAFLLAIAAIILARLLSPLLFIIALVNLILSVCYTLFLKKMPIISHISIAYLNTTIILFGCLLVALPTLAIWLVSLAGFFFTLAQEIILVVEDYLGDKLTGVRTTAVYFGVGTALSLFRIFALLTVVVMLIPWLLGLVSNLYLYVLLPCTILPIIMAFILVTQKITDQNIRLSSKLILWSRALSLLPILLLGFNK